MPDKSHPTPFPTTRIYEKLANILPRPQKNSTIRLYNDVLPQQRLLIETLLHTPPHRSIRTYHRERTNVRRPCRAQPPLSSTLKQPPRPRLDPAPPAVSSACDSFFTKWTSRYDRPRSRSAQLLRHGTRQAKLLRVRNRRIGTEEPQQRACSRVWAGSSSTPTASITSRGWS